MATVVLQFYVLAIAFSAMEFQAGTERYDAFLAPHGGLTGRLYSDFFTLTTYDPGYSFGSFTMAFEWKLPRIGLPDIPWDIILSQISQLAYMVGLGVLLIEKAIGIIMDVLEKVGEVAA